MADKIKNNMIARKFTIHNNGNNKITIEGDAMSFPVDRAFFENDSLTVTYNFKIKELTLLQKVKFLFGFINIEFNYTI